MTVKLEIYSPRWGHNDIYTIQLLKDMMIITQGAFEAKCIWRENIDSEWTGESLENILNNDSIYPPTIFQELIEHAWKSWRDHILDDTSVTKELHVLAAWLNEITKHKPETEFWSKYF